MEYWRRGWFGTIICVMFRFNPWAVLTFSTVNAIGEVELYVRKRTKGRGETMRTWEIGARVRQIFVNRFLVCQTQPCYELVVSITFKGVCLGGHKRHWCRYWMRVCFDVTVYALLAW